MSDTVTPRRPVNGRPDPQWIRGRCPECGDDLVSNLYYIGGKGYVIRWECWGSLQETPTCSYKHVLEDSRTKTSGNQKGGAA